MLSPERCRWCKGTGRLGRIGNIILVCETCGGSGMTTEGRCYLKT